MKHLKLYESFYDNKIQDLKKFISHIIKVFSEYGLDYQSYYEKKDCYTTEFYLEEDHNYLFAIEFFLMMKFEIMFTVKNSLYMMHQQSEFLNFLPEYFDKIEGVEEYSNDIVGVFDGKQSEYMFTVKGNVDDVISQITLDNFKEEFEIYKNSKKYNV